MDKPKRVRKRSITGQIQEVLNTAQNLDSEPTNELTIARMKFLQVRLAVLSKMQTNEKNKKLEKAELEVERLTAENEKLRGFNQELAVLKPLKPTPDTVMDDPVAAMLKRVADKRKVTLREATASQVSRPLTEVEHALAQYEASKNGGAND